MDKMNAEEVLRGTESDSDDSITVTIGEIKNDIVSLQLGRIGSSADLTEVPRSFDDTPFMCNAGASQFYFPPEIFINDSLPPFIEDMSVYETEVSESTSCFLECPESDCGFSLAADILDSVLDNVMSTVEKKPQIRAAASSTSPGVTEGLHQPQMPRVAPTHPPRFTEGFQQQYCVTRSASGPELGEGESAALGQQSCWNVPACPYALNPLQHSSAESIFGSCASRESQLRESESAS